MDKPANDTQSPTEIPVVDALRVCEARLASARFYREAEWAKNAATSVQMCQERIKRLEADLEEADEKLRAANEHIAKIEGGLDAEALAEKNDETPERENDDA